MNAAESVSVVDVLREANEELKQESTKEISQTINYSELNQFEKRKRRKYIGENIKPTPLQVRYQRQIRTSRNSQPDLVKKMSNLVAWTWLPGRDRVQCPPIIDIRDARLLTIDRFPDEINGLPYRIALSMYRTRVSKYSRICHAGPNNLEMFKDFSFRPHYGAGGLCLDSRNEEVFRTALALDMVMELAVKGKANIVSSFDPPMVLYGFPSFYVPKPEWRAPMQQALVKALQPGAPVMHCFTSPGGLIIKITETADGFRNISIEREGNLIQIRIPIWAPLNQGIQQGVVTSGGQPLADLPRDNYIYAREITSKYPLRGLEWLEQRIIEELSEFVTVEETILDKQNKQLKRVMNTWRCIPAPYVTFQGGSALRFFLDMRTHLGRDNYEIDATGKDTWKKEPHKVRIDVCTRENNYNLRFDSKGGIVRWNADMMTQPVNAKWLDYCANRGNTNVQPVN